MSDYDRGQIIMADIIEVSDKLKSLIAKKGDMKAQYTVALTQTREITMENGEFTLFRTLFDNHVSIEVIKDKKHGTTKLNKFDDKSLEAALDDVLLSAQAGSEDEFFDIAPGMEPAQFHLGAENPDVDKLMQRAREFSDDIAKRHPKILVMQIILKHVSAHSIYRNTNGSQDEKISGYYEVVVEFAGNDGTNSTGIAGTQVVTDNLDMPFIELGSIEKDLQDAEDSFNPVTVEGKFDGKVIFTPACAVQMIYYALSNFAGESAVLDGTGLWLGKVGEKVAADKLTIAMKPWDERIVNHEVHTDDGFRSEDYTIIENGVMKSYMTSLYAANKCKVERAKNSGFDIVVEGGDIAFSDMVKGIKRGLIVGAVSCGTPSGNGELSGVAKNSFYVEDGQIKGAVTETMINFNLADMMQNVTALSKEVLCDGTMVVPYIEVEHILISGK